MKLNKLIRIIGAGFFAIGLVGFLISLGAGKISEKKAEEMAAQIASEQALLAEKDNSEPVKLTDETPMNSTQTGEDNSGKAVVEEILPGGMKASEETSETSEVATSEKATSEVSSEDEAAKKAEEEAAKKAEEEAKKKAEEEAAKKAEEEAKKKAEEEAAKKAEEEAKKKAEEEAAKKAEEEAKKKAEEDAKKPTGETVTITVQPGQFSESVAKACKDAGLVADAAKFDKYLCDNGYATRISTGDHVISKGASEEEIAKALCK